MNSRGFTLYELLIGFVIGAVVVYALVILVNNTRTIKDQITYENDMMITSDNIASVVYKDLKSLGVSSIDNCTSGDKCIEINYRSGHKRKFFIDIENNIINYNGKNYNLPKNARLSSEPKIQVDCTLSKCILDIKIPLTHKFLTNTYYVLIKYIY
jgi:hypothetical protein